MGRFDEIPEDAATYQVHNAVFWLHDGVMFGKHIPDAPGVSLEDVIGAFQKFKEMTAGERVPFMFDARGLSLLGFGARAYIRANAPDVFSHAAIVVRRELVRLLSHAFIGAAGVDMPIQLFTDEDEAWDFVVNDQSDAA